MNIKQWIPFYKVILFRTMSKDFLLPHNLLENDTSPVNSSTHYPLSLSVCVCVCVCVFVCLCKRQSPVGSMYFQPEAPRNGNSKTKQTSQDQAGPLLNILQHFLTSKSLFWVICHWLYVLNILWFLEFHSAFFYNHYHQIISF